MTGKTGSANSKYGNSIFSSVPAKAVTAALPLLLSLLSSSELKQQLDVTDAAVAC